MASEKGNDLLFFGILIAAILLGNHFFASSKATGVTCAPINGQAGNAPCPCGG